MVAMPRDLPGMKAEMSLIMEGLGASACAEMLEQPEATSVMHHIHQCNIVHFACPGISDATDPSQSGILLQTTTAEPRQDILTVRQLRDNRYARGGIAYLSTCSTAGFQFV